MFRIWDKLNKEFIGFYSSNLYIYENGQIYQGNINVTSRYELMQYTEIHDNTEDENEIFENDIIEFNYKGELYKGIIKFEVGSFIVACNDIDDGYIWLHEIVESDRDYRWINGKIIGNIYENPVQEYKIVTS
jgi:uncharacterized phage protein (TIGR01671 family)